MAKYIKRLVTVLSLTLILLLSSAFARESFQFNVGDKVSILSDKAFRKKEGDTFEALGNVVITHGTEAIYGEKASLSLISGDVEVIGNVRFIGEGMTLYGSELRYNFKSDSLEVKNARVLSENYSILGKAISRPEKNIIVANDAEYTTCKDCPESWTIFGKRVRITTGEYVKIEHAFVKVKGVIVMYFPYVIFPIKKERDTGLLFPKISLDLSEGATFQQPWFWAISPSKDLTFTPSIFGRRGAGSELQYRQMVGDQKWFELNTLNVADRIYLPEKKNDDLSGQHFQRFFGDYEHHFSFGNSFAHHLYYNAARDLDTMRDYDSFTKEKLQGSSLGGGGFFDLQHSIFDITAEGYFNRNQLVDNPKEFDHSYVQILPKVSLSTLPINLISTDLLFLKGVNTGLKSDFTIFHQNHFSENQYIRNAERWNLQPYVNWQLGQYGPFFVQTSMTMDYQHYDFPYEKSETSFSKSGIIYQTDVTFEVQKIYGVAYKDKVPVEKVDWKAYEEVRPELKSKDQGLLGSLPQFGERYNRESIEYENFSYKYGQEYKIRHYLTTDQKASGNQKFNTQIEKPEGRFDAIDAIRDRKNELSFNSTSLGIPTTNTLELQWNNSIIRKKIRESISLMSDGTPNKKYYEYKKISYFNLSQGLILEGTNSEHSADKLTRLALSTGLDFSTYILDLNEYYIYTSQKHIIQFSTKKVIGQHSVYSRVTYNSLPESLRKFITLGGTIVPVDQIKIVSSYDYDIESKQTTQRNYEIEYHPSNNCWMLSLSLLKTQVENRYSMNFLINYNSKSFTALN